MLVFSPIKTYRLFVKLKQEGRLREEQDWIARDQKLFLDVPRFFTELEADGYKNMLREDVLTVFPQATEIIRNHLKSNDIERNQHEFAADEKREENSEVADPPVKSNEIRRNQMNTNENSLQSDDIAEPPRIAAEIVQAKNEIIEVLKESLRQTNEQLTRAERDKEHYRKEMDYLAQQNQRLTQLTYMLSAPNREPKRSEPPPDRSHVYTGPVGEQEEEEEREEPAVRVDEAQDEETPMDPRPEEPSVHVHVTGEEENASTL